MLQALLAKLAGDGAPSRLTALVRADNAASLRAFAAAGFHQASTGAEFLELEWP
jgi:RimJ/RimL family protein N-acetyltransferase